LSKDLDAYMAAKEARDAVRADAKRIAEIVSGAAKMLAESPSAWSFGQPPNPAEYRDGGTIRMDPKWPPIDTATWPHAGDLLVLKERYAEADRKVQAAFKALSENEKKLVLPQSPQRRR